MLYVKTFHIIHKKRSFKKSYYGALRMDETDTRQEINKYKKFKKVDGATYHKVNQFLRKRTYITAREWALARLCTDFRTSGGAEMTFIGQHLPELVPFMEDTYSPQAVNQARNAFKRKVRKSSATFFYGAMCGFFTTDELDDLLFEASEVARFLLEVEGTTLDIDEEIDIEDRITKVMRGVGEAAKTLLQTRDHERTGKEIQLKTLSMTDPDRQTSQDLTKDNGTQSQNITSDFPSSVAENTYQTDQSSQTVSQIIENKISGKTISEPNSSPGEETTRQTIGDESEDL